MQHEVLRGLFRRDLYFAPFELVILAVLPGVSAGARLFLVAIYLLGFLPATWIAHRTVERGKPVDAVVRVYAVAVAMLFTVVGVVVPSLQAAVLAAFVALYGMLLVVGERRASILAVVLAVGGSTIAYVLTPGETRFGVASLIVLPLTFSSFGPMISGVLGRHEAAIARLDRVRAALARLDPSPDADDTLCSLAAGVCEACDATFAAILVSNGELDARCVEPRDLAWTDVARACRIEGVASAWSQALTSGSVCVQHGVPHVDRDEAATGGLLTVVAAPIRVNGEIAGALVVGVDADAYEEDLEAVVVECAGAAVGHFVIRALAMQELADAAEELREVVAAEEQAVSVVSHELKSPLTATIGFLATLERNWDRLPDERRLDLLSRAHQAAVRQAGIVSRMLDTVRATKGQLTVAARPLQLVAEVDRVLRDFESELAGHSVLVHVDEHITVRGDPDAFDRILGNLLVNAAKYAPPGTTIVVTAAVREGQVIVSVADEGPGIPPGEIDRVFDPYVRGRTTPGAGAGIGLHLVRSYVELLGGTVSVISRPGEGSTFYFSLVPAVVDPLDAPEPERTA